MLFSALGAVVVLASSTFGSPLEVRALCGRDLANFKLPLPAGQTQVVAPPGLPVTGLLLGIGFQNYTCTPAGTYTSAGAVAELYDVSCMAKSPAAMGAMLDPAFAAWKGVPAGVAASPKSLLPSLAINEGAGQHYFITNAAGGISPKWDHTSSGSTRGNKDAFAVVKKTGGIASPLGASVAVDWLSLEVIEGKLASNVFRYDTRGGVAPSTCTPGSPLLSVKYLTYYAYFGGSVAP